MKNLDKKTKIILAAYVFGLVALTLGITYAFFTANTNNEKRQTIDIKTGSMILIFKDNDDGVRASLSVGESATKKFIIENTGTLDATAKINWVDLVNTYTDGSLVWDLQESDELDGPYTSIAKGNVPKEDGTIATNLLIKAGKKKYYNLVFTLVDLGETVNQDKDRDASFHTRFNIDEAIDSYIITLDDNNATTKGTEDVYLRYTRCVYQDMKGKTQMTQGTNPITIPKRSYTVSFNPNGGTTDTNSLTSNYTFDGYYDGETKMIDENGYVTDNFTYSKYKENTKLTAKRTPGPITLPSANYTGHTLGGWYSSNNGGTKYGDANTSYTPTKNLTMYADWSTNKYTITVNGGTGISSVSGSGSYDYGSKVTISANVSTGYTWSKWSDGNTNSSRQITVTGNATYTASATINKYYLDINPDSGIQSFDITINGTTLSNQTDYYIQNNYGTTATISNVKPKNGYFYTSYSKSGSLTEEAGSSKNSIKVKLGTGNGAVALTSFAQTQTADASYTNGSAVVSGQWIATYGTCSNGTATMTQCKFSGTVGGTHYDTVCNGGDYNVAATYMCTLGTGRTSNLYGRCNSSLPGNVSGYHAFAKGGGFPSSISC